MNTPNRDRPRWSTSCTAGLDDTGPDQLSALQRHATSCTQTRWVPLDEAVAAFIARHPITVLFGLTLPIVLVAWWL
jgi:hypothetical protein